MKKVFLTLALLLTTMVASAQFYVGGGLGVNKTENGDAEETVITVSPEIGYTINEDWTIGAALMFDWTKDVSTQYGISPYVRYNIFKAGKFSVFADGAVELGYIDYETADGDFAWGAGIKPGVGYQLTDKFSICAHIGWIGYRDYGDIAGEETTISVDGTDLSFSLYYSF